MGSPVTPETTSVPKATGTVGPTAGDTSAPKGGYPARARSSKGKKRGATFALGDPALEETLRQKDAQTSPSAAVAMPPPPEKPKSAVDVVAPPAYPKSSSDVPVPEPKRAPPVRETRTFVAQSAAELTETRVDAETAAELLKADVAPLTAFVAVDDSRREIARQSKGSQGKSVARRRSRSTSRGARARSVSPTRAKESEENLNRARLLEATKVPSPLHEEKKRVRLVVTRPHGQMVTTVCWVDLHRTCEFLW